MRTTIAAVIGLYLIFAHPVVATAAEPVVIAPAAVCTEDNTVVETALKDELGARSQASVFLSETGPGLPSQYKRGADGKPMRSPDGSEISEPISEDVVALRWQHSPDRVTPSRDTIHAWLTNGPTSAAGCWKTRTAAGSVPVVTEAFAQNLATKPFRKDGTIVRIGAPAYNIDRTEALVLIILSCPGMCGSENLLLMRKVGSAWIVIGHDLYAVS